MREPTATVATLQQAIETSRYRLETLGAGERLAERDKIARLERQLRALNEGAGRTAAAKGA